MYFASALPEIIILTFACLSLLADCFLKKHFRQINYYIAQTALILAALASIKLLNFPTVYTYSGMFSLDPISTLLKLFIYITSFFSFLYARAFFETEKNIPVAEYYVLGLFSVLGMMVMLSSENLIPLFLGLEILSLPLYAMIALKRHNAISAEAAMKYFIMGSFASAMLLYGMSLLYGLTQSLNIHEIANVFSQGMTTHNLVFACAIVFIVSGIAFKLGAAPFHVWAPDIYHGAPSIMSLFLGSAPKIAILGLTFKLLIQAMPDLQLQWRPLLILVALLSMGLGNIVAVAQTNLKRMLAYSSIAHMGYMSLGLIAGNQEGYAACIFYIFTYALMTLGGFAMISILSKSGIEAESIADFKGLNSKSPWLAFLMLLLMFSMAGVPPTVGFFAKLGVLTALVNVNLVWLATVALIFAIIGAYYYIAVIKAMYFESESTPNALPIIPLDAKIAISTNALLLLFLGFSPGFLFQLCQRVFL